MRPCPQGACDSRGNPRWAYGMCQKAGRQQSRTDQNLGSESQPPGRDLKVGESVESSSARS